MNLDTQGAYTLISWHDYVLQDTLNMAAASDFYKKLALDCSSQQIAVDLFALSGQFIDLTTICECHMYWVEMWNLAVNSF